MSNNTIPEGFCQCGCGQRTRPASCNDKRRNWIKGKPIRFISGHYTKPQYPFYVRFWRLVDKRGIDECWEWQGNRKAHGHGSYADTQAHRIAYELTYGPINNGLNVLHKCNNPPCVNPNHLYLGTQRDNAQDSREAGTMRTPPIRQGSKNNLAKLTEELVTTIRQRYANEHITCTALGTEFGITTANICYIVRRKTWKHIP